jgi:hypothetical protein
MKQVILAFAAMLMLMISGPAAEAAKFRNSGGSWESWSQRTGKPNPTQPTSTQIQRQKQQR